MELGATRRLTLSIGLLVGIQLLTSLGAIILLERMNPAIERIFLQNAEHLEALEQMALALAGPPGDPASRERFFRALARAKLDPATDEARPLLAELDGAASSALAGDTRARHTTQEVLRKLGAENRRAMDRADTNARRIGTAGAWAAAFLGLGGLLASALTVRRLERRVLGPIEEITRVVAAHRAGEQHRRCTTTAAQGELGLVVLTLNELFDLRERDGRTSPSSGGEDDDRLLLHHLLDERPEPVTIVGKRGEILVANRRTLDLLSGPGGKSLRAAVGAAMRTENATNGIEIRRVGDSEQWVCTLGTPHDRA